MIKKALIAIGVALLIIGVACIGVAAYIFMFMQIHETLYPGCK